MNRKGLSGAFAPLMAFLLCTEHAAAAIAQSLPPPSASQVQSNKAPPLAITTQPQHQEAVLGGTASFTVAAAGEGTITYQWHFNGAPIESATSATFGVINVQAANAGNYTVVVANSSGSVTSETATLTLVTSVTLTAQAGPGGAVRRDPDQASYPPHATVTVTATPNAGFAFVGWSGDANGTQNPLTVTMDAHKLIAANFAFTALKTSVQGTGAVARNPEKTSYRLGENVTLTALPGRYYAFSQWADGLIANPRSIAVSTNNNYTAIFTNTVPLETFVSKQWERSFGGTLDDWLQAVVETSDGGYLIGGYSVSSVSGNKTSAGFGFLDMWVIKLDSEGNKQWEQSYGGTGGDRLRALVQTSDGGFMLAGYSNSGVSGNKESPNYGQDDFWLVKVDASGMKQWDRSFGGTGADRSESLHQTADGGYIVAGSSDSAASGNKTSSGFGQTDHG